MPTPARPLFRAEHLEWKICSHPDHFLEIVSRKILTLLLEMLKQDICVAREHEASSVGENCVRFLARLLRREARLTETIHICMDQHTPVWNHQMTTLTHTRETTTVPQKSRSDWLASAINALKSGGIDTVQITALARDLAMTRGSFYWHFKNRDDLLQAIIDEWRARNTGVMLDALKDAPSLDDGLLSLFAIWIDHTRFDAQLDQAVRDWSRHAPDIAEIVTAEDNNRIIAIAEFLFAFGFVYPETFIRARVIYLTQVSHYALGITDPVEARISYLNPYFMCFIGRPADPAAADRYFAKYYEILDREAQ